MKDDPNKRVWKQEQRSGDIRDLARHGAKQDLRDILEKSKGILEDAGYSPYLPAVRDGSSPFDKEEDHEAAPVYAARAQLFVGKAFDAIKTGNAERAVYYALRAHVSCDIAFSRANGIERATWAGARSMFADRSGPRKDPAYDEDLLAEYLAAHDDPRRKQLGVYRWMLKTRGKVFADDLERTKAIDALRKQVKGAEARLKRKVTGG